MSFMSFHMWLQDLRSALAPRRGRRHHSRRRLLRTATHRPNLEVLEDRLTPSLNLGPFYPGWGPASPPPPLFADFTSDGIDDVILVSSTGLSVFAGSPANPGTFATWTRSHPNPAHLLAARVAYLGDANGDGFGDIAVAGTDATAMVFAGSPDGPGLRPGRVFRLVLAESTILCIVGGFLGTALAMTVLGIGGMAIGAEGVTIAFRPSVQLAITSMSVSFLVGLVAGVFPALSAARTPIVTALRQA